jgi:hypothetical protein
MEKFKKIVKLTFVAVVLIAISVLIFLMTANYSTGVRAGVPTKFSKKGVIFKTWEGTLNVGGLTSSSQVVMPTTCEFTVRRSSKDVAKKINQAMVESRRVKLLYHEKYRTFFWMGDTKYFVYEVDLLD